MAAEDFASQVPTNSEQDPDSSGGVNVTIHPTQQQLVGGSILNGLVKAKSYIDTLPTEEVGAAMLALQIAMGPVKGTATLAANLALDAVAGDKIEELKQEISLSTISALIGYDRNLLEGDLIAGRYNTQTKVEATEFLIFTVLAGTINLKGGGKNTGVGSRFADQAKLDDHFNRHGADFGTITKIEYQQAADNFLTGPKNSTTLELTRTNGDVVRFDPATDAFGVISSNGAIRTYYKPDPQVHGYPTNLDYFNAQLR
ncbi:hypothetical protein O4H49_20485, partial [Kiloniella laminariae]